LIAVMFVQARDTLAPVHLQYRQAGAAEQSQAISSMSAVCSQAVSVLLQ